MNNFHQHGDLEWAVQRELSQRRTIPRLSLRRKLKTQTAEIDGALEPLQHAGLLSSQAGKKDLALRRDQGHVVAVDMGASNVRYLLANVSGEIRVQAREKLSNAKGSDGAIKQVTRRITALLKQVKGRAKLRSIAIGVPSAVHPETRLLISANNLSGWEHVPMGRRLGKEFGVPVVVDKDCNMAAVGEHWRGAAAGMRDFIFVGIGTGIGTGLFLNGKIYPGTHRFCWRDLPDERRLAPTEYDVRRG